MTGYELAMQLLQDRKNLDKQIYVNDKSGLPTRNFFFKTYNDVDGLYLEGFNENIYE